MEAYIKAISYYLPEKVLTNEDLVRDFPNWDAEKVASKTGVVERHISADNETAGDMAVNAAQKLFAEYEISPSAIDFILFCTQSPDYHLPSTSCIIQNRLGVSTSSGALDYNLGCSGYEYGLALAKGLIVGGLAKNVLLLTSETYSKYLHSDDYGDKSIFGDGAAATLVSSSGKYKIGEFVFGTDGSGADKLIVRTGGARNKEPSKSFCRDEGGYVNSPDYLYMDGTGIFNFSLDVVPAMVKQVLCVNELSEDEIDGFVFHQANKFMLNNIRKICNLPKEKFYIDLKYTGNTVSSTVPIALKNYLAENTEARKIVLAGFGVGLSWSACVITKND